MGTGDSDHERIFLIGEVGNGSLAGLYRMNSERRLWSRAALRTGCHA
jgi:hypothetical protein